MSKTNGRIIGPYQGVNFSTSPTGKASGIHSSFDQYNYRLNDEWPYPFDVQVSLSTTSLNETTNRDLTVTLNTTGYPSGTQFSVAAENVSNFSTSDMNPYFGSVTVSGDQSSATGNVVLSVVDDFTDETPDTETFKVVVRGPAPETTVVAESGNVTISDTSTFAPSVSLSFYEHARGTGIDDVYVYLAEMNSDGSSIVTTTQLYSRSGPQTVAAWEEVTASDNSLSSGDKFRIVFEHDKQNTSFIADYAIDDVTINGTNYSFETNATGWLTSTTQTTSAASAFLNATGVLTTTSASRARWNRDTGTTPSGNTGPTNGNDGTYFLYTEASSPNTTNPTNFWLFSPEFTIS